MKAKKVNEIQSFKRAQDPYKQLNLGMPIQKTKNSGGGTSFHGDEVSTSPNKLIELANLVGAKSYYDENYGDDKVNFEFDFETVEGNIFFTVYDWKEYRVLDGDEYVNFHIGAYNSNDSHIGYEALINALEFV